MSSDDNQLTKEEHAWCRFAVAMLAAILCCVLLVAGIYLLFLSPAGLILFIIAIAAIAPVAWYGIGPMLVSKQHLDELSAHKVQSTARSKLSGAEESGDSSSNG